MFMSWLVGGGGAVEGKVWIAVCREENFPILLLAVTMLVVLDL